MNLETRKIAFVQQFLKLKSEETISRLEKMLSKEKNTLSEHMLEPMTQDDLDKRIDQSESDFQNNQFKSSEVLLAKYE